jgi:hypothetical protein
MSLYFLVPSIAAAATVQFRLFPTLRPNEDVALTSYIGKVFSFAQTAILLLATAVITGAGILYMASAGNTKQIELAKKLIFGALSGVATIVLGRFFLQYVIGVPWIT